MKLNLGQTRDSKLHADFEANKRYAEAQVKRHEDKLPDGFTLTVHELFISVACQVFPEPCRSRPIEFSQLASKFNAEYRAVFGSLHARAVALNERYPEAYRRRRELRERGLW